MNENARNLAVGLTVLVAGILLAGMIVLFTGLPQVFQTGYKVQWRIQTTGGVSEGDQVHVAGMAVGRVTDIRFADRDAPAEGVLMIAQIDEDVRISTEATVYIHRGLMGGAYIEILDKDPAPSPQVQTDQPVTINARIVGGSPMEQIQPLVKRISDMADEVGPALQSFGELAENLNALIAPPAPTDANAVADANALPAPGDPNAPANLRTTLSRLDAALAGLANVLGDANTQKDIKTTFNQLAQASAKASDAMDSLQTFASRATEVADTADRAAGEIEATAVSAREDLDKLAAGLVEDADRLSQLLATLNQVAVKLNRGEGSAGKFINDPQLYNQLLAATRSLEQTLTQLRRSLARWEETGLPLKLK